LQLLCLACTQTPTGPANNSSTKIEKIRLCPSVSSAGSSEEWSYFITRWGDYKEATKITGKDFVN